ncbi:MAG: hypothetical protein JSS30_08150 [Verrucomicrobia bacterium]|nr:hypothetical protein [Verrucomicrobiota bacterium]
MGFGSNLAGMSVDLFNLHEVHTHEKHDRINKEIDELVSKMEKLENFLALLANQTDDSNRVDLLSQEHQDFVDALRKHDDLRHLFPEGKYSWKDKELENLTRSLNQHIEGPLQRKINMKTEETVLDQHELTKALDLFKNGLSRMSNLIERILNNLQRSH